MRCDPKKLWYHGDTSRRLTFEDQRFQNRDNPNAVGPGIYFTESREQARGYAWPRGWLYTARIRGRCATGRQRMTASEIQRFIGMLDDEGRGYLLSNWDEDPRRAMSKVLDAYTQINLTSAAADLGRQGGLDFLSDGRTWARAMVALGYVAMVHQLPNVQHLVVWDPNALTIMSEEKVTKRRR